MRRRAKLSLLLAVWLCGLWEGCGAGSMPGQPDLPASVSPGWTRKSYADAPPPSGLPAGPAPRCWKADYAGAGTAEVWTCAYRASGSAFDAQQRARAEADTVKFQEGNYLVIVKWSGGSRAEVTALIRAVQNTLHAK
jgi:hypothetical protein